MNQLHMIYIYINRQTLPHNVICNESYYDNKGERNQNLLHPLSIPDGMYL